MTRASTPTLLSLERYAKIMGINPMHFASATANRFWPLQNSCSDIWLQYQWQGADPVAREELGNEIRIAEIDLARELGWWVAPTWTYQEIKDFPRLYRKDTYRVGGRNVRGQRVSIKAEYAKMIAGGRRATELVEAGVAVTYTDEDGDGFAETATLSCTTTLSDVFEIYVFTASKSGDAAWEIRPVRTKAISGGTFTATLYSWQMIDPELWEAYPTVDGVRAIDLRGLEETPVDTTNLVATVDVYRVYNDTTAVSALMLWEPQPANSAIGYDWGCTTSSGCTACGLISQDGCMHVRDALRGIVVPAPATYDDDNAVWSAQCFSECRDPDMVKLWYYSGDVGNQYLGGYRYDRLSERWAKAIAQLATARLERPLCSCGNLVALTTKWQMDMAIGGELSFNINEEDLNNPFGTRYGEVLAWREVKRERHVIRGGGAI